MNWTLVSRCLVFYTFHLSPDMLTIKVGRTRPDIMLDRIAVTGALLTGVAIL